VAVDPDYPEVIYAGTDIGVFISRDSGQVWHSFQTGMPTAMVNDLKVFGPDRKIRAATHGNGVFERDLFDPTTTDVAWEASAPTLASLRVYPNPVQAGSRIHFDMPRAAQARLSLYDVQGRRVSVLIDQQLSAGPHELPLATERLSSGVYFLRLETAESVWNSRVVYLR
jgi:hypothetical protein